MSETEDLKTLLAELRERHRALDAEIAGLTGDSAADQLQIQRLKKQKLSLKDEISLIETNLLPDIIA